MEGSIPNSSQASSDESADIGPSPDMEEGSEYDWRDSDDGVQRPVFFMGEDDTIRLSSPAGFHRNVEGHTIRVGICAMAKKANSKPMKEILERLRRFEHLQITVFDEDVVTHSPVSEWPVVDALIAFFSAGFPLEKAIEYKNLHKPYVINDLEAQYTLKDRREVYKILSREGIPHPRYAVMNRDEEEKGKFDENEDAIEVNGVTFQRPFVEKPVNAEDHNIYIYFPVSAGGGCQRLFRKVGSRSSVYSTINRVRKSGSFIYEDFMPTDGTDVKVYTVGPDYAHAEARKSPALDGKVERDKEGKEVRYPVLLSALEKMIARKVVLAFKQNVCGFDLLRTGGKSYVCDVNGFSFVKNSTKYYDDCANVLGTMMVRALAPQLHIQNVALVLGAAPEDIPVVPTTSGSMMELRCVIAVIRHGDRTPKQKMKMEVKHKKFFELFKKYDGYKKGHLKLKKPKQLQEVLDIARDLLAEGHHSDLNPEVQEKKAKLKQLKLVLEMYGHFSGINRKVQLKYQPNGAPKKSSSEEGLNYESDHKYTPPSHEYPKEPSLVLIVKWGGELTPAGKYQAEDLGKAFRTLYPGGQGEFETPGLGFLRLHSTFRHDLKIYASDEGRVQMTAAAFTKGLLALEGELTPILVSMVKSANTNGLLDKEGETSKYQHVVKERLMEILNQDQEFTEEHIDKLAPTSNKSLLKAIEFIKNPKQMCDRVYEMVKEITAKIKTLKLELKTRELKLYHGESWELLIRRWAKLEKDFKMKTGNYDISKIPDIYDCIKYDLQHNQKTLQYERAEELFLCSKSVADIVIPQEYGITVEEKVHISQSICSPLMRKIHSDLHQGCLATDEESTRLNSKYSKGVSSPERFVRTRLYFTSESHIHSLLNMLRFGGLCDEMTDEQWKKAMDFLSTTPELNYMTQINIMMFEDPSKDPSSPEKFHVELHFSPGAYTNSDKSVVNPASSGYRTSFLVRQNKKGHESLIKKVDGEVRADDIIPATITEESLTDEASEVTSPQTQELISPQTQELTSPQTQEVTSPQTQELTSPQMQEVTFPQTQEVTSPQTQDGSSPQSSTASRQSPQIEEGTPVPQKAQTEETRSALQQACNEEGTPVPDQPQMESSSVSQTSKSESYETERPCLLNSEPEPTSKSASQTESSPGEVETGAEQSPTVGGPEQLSFPEENTLSTCGAQRFVKSAPHLVSYGKGTEQSIPESVDESVEGEAETVDNQKSSENNVAKESGGETSNKEVSAGGTASSDSTDRSVAGSGNNDDESKTARPGRRNDQEMDMAVTRKFEVRTVKLISPADAKQVAEVEKDAAKSDTETIDRAVSALQHKLGDQVFPGEIDESVQMGNPIVDSHRINPDIKISIQEASQPISSTDKPKDVASSKPEIKDLENSTHDDVIFSEVFEKPPSSDDDHDDHSRTITSETVLLKQDQREVPAPKSPDPDIPEWDWDDAIQSEKSSSKQSSSDDSGHTLVNSVSKPISISVTSPSKHRSRADSYDSLKGFDDKRSRSFEDQEHKGNMESAPSPLPLSRYRPASLYPFRYSLSDVCSLSLRDDDTFLEKHYCTIHLPIKDSHHSFSSLLYLNPEAFKDSILSHHLSDERKRLYDPEGSGAQLAPPVAIKMVSYSSPQLSDMISVDKAFDGFNMVPSLKPLETLHNNLTMRDLDAFLSRATTTKFFTPVGSPLCATTPLPSPKCPELGRTKSMSGTSYPSSSNSSAGPSSPTTGTTPIDFMDKFKQFIDHSKAESLDLMTPDVDSQNAMQNPNFPLAPTNQNSASSSVQPIKSSVTTQPQSASQQTGSNTVTSTTGSSSSGNGHQSAFKLVSRAGSQKSSFKVSQVPEDSLRVKKTSESEQPSPQDNS